MAETGNLVPISKTKTMHVLPIFSRTRPKMR